MEDFEKISIELVILITWKVLKTTSARNLPPEILISLFQGQLWESVFLSSSTADSNIERSTELIDGHF